MDQASYVNGNYNRALGGLELGAKRWSGGRRFQEASDARSENPEEGQPERSALAHPPPGTSGRDSRANTGRQEGGGRTAGQLTLLCESVAVSVRSAAAGAAWADPEEA